LLTSASGAAIARLMPEISETIVYPAPWMKAGSAGAEPDRHLELIADLRARRFDGAVIFTVYSQSPLPAALACLLAGIPLRAAHCRENPYELLTDWLPEPEPGSRLRHEVRRQLDLVAVLGATVEDDRLSLSLSEAAQARAAAALGSAGIGVDRDRHWAVVHPGSTAPSRRYPPELLALACRELREDHGVQLVFTGDSEEVALVDAVRDALPGPAPSLAGALDLEELAAVLAAAPVLIAGNTGPVHLAAAVGTPVVDLYALTNPQHTPWMVPSAVLYHDVPCRWCYKSVCPEGHHLCLRGVSPAAVVDAALALLRDGVRSAAETAGEPLRLGSLPTA
jgi:lipopolysaccharide heptosyltransferase II